MLASPWIGGFAAFLATSRDCQTVAFIAPSTNPTCYLELAVGLKDVCGTLRLQRAHSVLRQVVSSCVNRCCASHPTAELMTRRHQALPTAGSGAIAGNKCPAPRFRRKRRGVRGMGMAATESERRREDYPSSSGGIPQADGRDGQEGSLIATTVNEQQGDDENRVSAVASSATEGLEWSQIGTECKKRVFVCTNRWCREKGSSATLGSFVGLAPEGEVLVQGVNCLGRCNKGPNLRVLQEDGNWLEFNRIESVERVYKILRDYLGADVSKEAAVCLKYNFLANGALDRNEVTQAIEYYDKAIATGYVDQQGVLLVMRATAFMQRAYSHWRALTELLQKAMVDMPTQQTLGNLREVWQASGPRARVVLLGIFALDCEGRGSLYQKSKFRYSLYEFALLRACEDALKATETLPNYPQCWLKAADALSNLKKPKEAAGYYQVALDLDPSIESYVRPKIDALREGNGEDALLATLTF